MPLTRVSLRRGKPPAYRKTILEGVHKALQDTFAVPKDDQFMLVNELDEADFLHSRSYLGISHSDDFVVIELAVSDTRGVAEKKALYRRIVDLLAADPGLKPEDVFINLVEVKRENWSFGNGVAQYA